jgi:hypothetical protein
MNVKEFRFNTLGRASITVAALSAGVAFAAGPYPDAAATRSALSSSSPTARRLQAL